MKIIAGLGNPGTKYGRTRHNAGFLALDYICQAYGMETRTLAFKSLCAKGTIAGERVLILRPQTYMNNSGEAVREALAFHKLGAQDLIVLCDDATLACGSVRIRGRGSSGGHNGLESIIELIGSDEFTRVRLGVGEPKSEGFMGDLADWVLGDIPKQAHEAMFEALKRASDSLPVIITEGWVQAASRFNLTVRPEEKKID